MEDCYSLLGIAATAFTDQIEDAYQRKKMEFSADPVMLQALDNAYNEAIMATFAPIRAFSSPLPPLTTGKKSPPVVQPSGAQPQGAQAPDVPYTAPYIALSSVDPAVRELVKEVPVSFTDDELLNMDVSELRESFAPKNEKGGPGFMSLGIENSLMRQYAWTYIGLAVFDIVMRASFGPKWLAVAELVNPSDAVPTPPAYLSAFFALLSVVYCFICSIPVPFVIRFFLLGQPPEKAIVMYGLFSLSVALSQILQRFTGFLLLPEIAGSGVTFTFASMLLAFETLRYAGD